MSAEIDNTEEKLVLIPREHWPELRDLYLRDYPKHILSYYNLKMYIDWVEKGITMDVNIYSIDNEWRKHGIYLILDRLDMQLSVHLDMLFDEDEAVLLKAIKTLDTKPMFRFVAFPKMLQPVVSQYMNELGFTDLTDLLYPTVLYHMPKEEILKMKITDKSGYIVKPLDISNIKQINDLWPHRSPGSDRYIGRMITNNLSLGIFMEENDELCAWIIQSEVGFLAILHVEPKYQRRGLGEYIVALMAKRLAELKNMDATAAIINTNEPSIKLFNKLGFKVINEIHWIVKPALP